MFGPPKPVEGKCNARFYIADDYGDNHATIQCQLDKGHGGDHCESGRRDANGLPTFKITWSFDEGVDEGEIYDE
jgi:hypothetical protein